jgi:hypothetical protein
LQYKAVSVPYPKDKKNLAAEIDTQEKQAVSGCAKKLPSLCLA